MNMKFIYFVFYVEQLNEQKSAKNLLMLVFLFEIRNSNWNNK